MTKPRFANVRFARPTDRMDECVRFYRDALGLPVLATFEDHAGYDGVMLGLPGWEVHLELTSHRDGSPCPAPTKDNLLVLYFEDSELWAERTARLEEWGHQSVEPENPYWRDKSLTFVDPDGWRVVLVDLTRVTPN